MRIVNILVGILMLPLAIISIAFPSLSIEVLITLLAIALLILGVNSIVRGVEDRHYQKWYRAFVILFGIGLIVLATIVFIFDSFATLSLIMLLAGGFMILGIRRLIEGIAGYQTILIEETEVILRDKKN